MSDINLLATEFVDELFSETKKNTQRLNQILEQLACHEKDSFDLVVGQLLKVRSLLDPEEWLELSQEAMTYTEDHPNAAGHYVPGIVNLRMNPADRQTLLKSWKG